jgi:hypothetical protein
LDKVDGLRLEKVLKVHQGRCILASGNRNASILFDPRQPGIVFWRPNELFEPLEIEGAQLARHVERFANGRRAIDVEHYLGVSTCGFAGGACAGDVDLVQFETAKAAAQRPRYVLSDQLGIGVPGQARVAGKHRSVTASKKLMDRFIGNLAGDIPKRNVDSGEPVDEDAAAPEDVEFLLQIEHQLANLRGVAADALRGKDGVNGDLCGWNRRKAECLAPTENPGVGCDCDD